MNNKNNNNGNTYRNHESRLNEQNRNENHLQNRRNNKPKRKTTVILGDSIISRVNGLKLSKSLGGAENIVVKSFSGATTDDMRHHAIPTSMREPERIILHCGANDLKAETSSEYVAENIMRVAHELSRPTNTIAISLLCPRNDQFARKANEVNNLLEDKCLSGNIPVIFHRNMSSHHHLWRDGIHLNQDGLNQLVRNFRIFLSNG